MKQKIVVALISVSITLLLAELALRFIVKVEPGAKYPISYFKRVEKLIVKHGFNADTAGIQKVESFTQQQIGRYIAAFRANPSAYAIADTECYEAYIIVKNWLQFSAPAFKCDLKKYVQSKGFPQDDADSAILHYLTNPVNEDGFRSIAFRPYSSKKKKVLLLGDSFTWGLVADNELQSFADNLMAKGYIVYNTGIPATDGLQYQLVAEKYIPLLKPDIVIANVYLGNDVAYHPRTTTPLVSQAVSTNAGTLITNFDGVQVANADSVYNILLDNNYIPADYSLFNKLCTHSAIGTLLWRFCAKQQWTPYYSNKYSFIWNQAKLNLTDTPQINTCLQQIHEVCNKHQCRFITAVIPMYNGNTFNGVADFKNLFIPSPYYVAAVSKQGYEPRYDGHFNNLGHMEYANFLDSLLRAK